MATKKDEQIEKIADLFYQAILDGTAPWTKEWKAADFRQLSHNPVSEKAYAGMNTLLLDTVRAAKGYESNGWLTFKQAKELEGNIKKGEKGTQISFFSMLQVDSKKNPDEKEFVPMTKYYTVFNIDQTENINQENITDDEFAKALKISKEDLHKRGFESEFVYIDDLKNNTNSLSEIVSNYKKDDLSKDYETSKNEDNKLNTFSDKYDLNLDERTALKELVKGYDKNDNSALEQIRAEMNNSTQVKNLDQVESKAHEQLETNSNNNTRRNK